ncbi:MAG: helix-turn-helix domain-containing protein [Nitrospinae bacterium]|nr:helix-turn-helix domain-containing protein [Nitrospinota bacterium]
MKPLAELTCYELLNVEQWASAKEIQRAYHAGLATYGSDSIAAHNVVEEEERARMRQQIYVAYRTLMDSEGRAKYDRSLSHEDKQIRKIPEILDATPITPTNAPKKFRGPNLKRHREALGINLETISYETKIRVSHFEAIEAENIEALPGPFFLRGFLKAYASCLGLDPDEVVKGFLESTS